MLLLIPLAVAAFFRDPTRRPDRETIEPNLVLSPADGKVMYVGPGQEGVAPTGEWQQISIFLSVFNVHINRTPYAGTVTEVTHQPGKWLAAYKHESAHLNERSQITLVNNSHDVPRKIIFRQIVGMLARRVVTRVKVGDELSTGQRMGLMKFGSRMDIFLPYDVQLIVSKGDKTVAGETELGRWTNN